MILTKNETWLLAAGYSVTKEDIRLKLNSKLYKNNYGEIKTLYYIDDIEEAKKLHKRYKKTFKRILSCFNDNFFNNCFIIKERNK